jgi:predicted secreted protein
MANTGYINGSDLLLSVGGKAVGHCSSHKVTYNSETKERAVKPVASQGSDAGLWKDKSVTGLSITISADGLRFYDETENGFTEMSALWGVGQAVEVKCFPRGDGKSTTQQSYLEGKFVITSIEEDAPAQDDATYSINLENAGMPTKFPGMGAAAAAKA